jgi:hypothetical protein
LFRDFLLKEPCEAVEGVNPRSDTYEKMKIATYNWWFATPNVVEDGRSEPGSPLEMPRAGVIVGQVAYAKQ